MENGKINLNKWILRTGAVKGPIIIKRRNIQSYKYLMNSKHKKENGFSLSLTDAATAESCIERNARPFR